jgi:hypothetical protein
MNPLDLMIVFFDKLVRLTCHKNSPYLLGNDRRQTFVYKKKQEIVKYVWTVSLILCAVCLQFPLAAGFVLIIAMITTFISFMILDETIEKRLDK